jgi:WD40 repeat protein
MGGPFSTGGSNIVSVDADEIIGNGPKSRSDLFRPYLNTNSFAAIDHHLRRLQVKVKKMTSDKSDGYAQTALRLIHETLRLLHFHVFTHSPAGVGAKNSLLFCPSNSTTRQRHLPSEFPELAVPPVIEEGWSRVIYTLRGHHHYIRSCAYSCDGRLLASASDDASVRIWDKLTGKAQYVLSDFGNWVVRVGFSAKGLLAASDKHTIKIWESATDVLLRDLNCYDQVQSPHPVSNISFSNDGSMLAAVGEKMITIWELPSYSIIVQQPIGTDNQHDKQEMSTPNYSHSLRVVQAVRKPIKAEETIDVDEQDVPDLAFSPDSKYLAAGTNQGEVLMWDSRDKDKEPCVFSGHARCVTSV